jgi:acyl-CoA thioesterase-1
MAAAMGAPRLGFLVVGLLAVCCAATACSSSSKSSSSTSSSGTSSIVALGDSVPAGTNCHCTPYPPLTAAALTASRGANGTATNDAVPGYTTSDVLEQVSSDRRVIEHVRDADVLEIQIGANDVAYSKSCGTTVDCYSPRIPTIEKNLTAIVDRVHKLTSHHKILVVLLDYWSVWLGGQYAAAKGPDYVAAAEEMTDRVNTVIKSTAADSHSGYVDLRAAFKGPNYTYDETHYLSNDGDHPNAAGHQRIAEATEAVIRATLHT